MNQTKIESFIEATVNVIIGYTVSMLITIYVIVPVWNLDWDTSDSFWATMIFTVASIIRSYLLRRFFNAGFHKLVHNAARTFAHKRWNKTK